MRSNAAVVQALRVGRIKILEVIPIELGDAVMRAGPDFALARLKARRDRVVRHSVVRRPGFNRLRRRQGS